MKTLIVFLSFIIFTALHEAGHFIACKICKVKVSEFSVGWGNAIWKKKIGDTDFSLRLCPVGGYCAMDDDSYNTATYGKQVFILSAGIIINLLTAFLLFFIATASISKAFTLIGLSFTAIAKCICDLFTGALTSGDFAGFYGTSIAVGNMMTGFKMSMLLFGLVSALLGIGNLLPLPGFDGGRIIGTLYEWITKRKISERTHRLVNTFMISFMILTVIFATWADVKFIWADITALWR